MTTRAYSYNGTTRDKVLALYAEGKSSNDMAKLGIVSSAVCLKILKRAGVTARDPATAWRQKSVDESFFEVIDTEEKAYWLGFITADGCVYNNRVIIGLASRDRAHLEKFTASLHSDYAVGDYKTTVKGKAFDHSSIHINSRKMFNDLKALGVYERKSLTAKPCAFVPESLAHHYWRGIFDGDGFVYAPASKLRTDGFPSWELGLVGSRPVVEGFRDFVTEVTGQVKPVRKHSSIYIVGYNSLANIKMIVNTLQAGSTIYLDRKAAMMKKALDTPEFRKTRNAAGTFSRAVKGASSC